jgi:hypothetical protein
MAADASDSKPPPSSRRPGDDPPPHGDSDHDDPSRVHPATTSDPVGPAPAHEETSSLNSSTVAGGSTADGMLKSMSLPRRPAPVHHPSESVVDLPESPSSISSISTASDTDSDDDDDSSDLSSSTDEDDMREATELHRVSSILRRRSGSRSTLTGAGGFSIASQASTAPDSMASTEMRRYRLRRQRAPRWYDGARRFWTRHVSIVVPANDQRDHLGEFYIQLTLCSKLGTEQLGDNPRFED